MSERSGGSQQSKQSGASEQVSGASEQANGRASGQVLQSSFLIILAHSAPQTYLGNETLSALALKRNGLDS